MHCEFSDISDNMYIKSLEKSVELFIIVKIWSPKWKPDCHETLTNLLLAKVTNLGKKRSKLNIGVRPHAKSVVVLGHKLSKFSRVTQFH